MALNPMQTLVVTAGLKSGNVTVRTAKGCGMQAPGLSFPRHLPADRSAHYRPEDRLGSACAIMASAERAGRLASGVLRHASFAFGTGHLTTARNANGIVLFGWSPNLAQHVFGQGTCEFGKLPSSLPVVKPVAIAGKLLATLAQA